VSTKQYKENQLRYKRNNTFDSRIFPNQNSSWYFDV